MGAFSHLIQVTDEEKERILKEHNMNQEEFDGSVEVLKTWIRQHDNISIDQEFDDHILRTSLLNNKMSLEKAKRAVEGYFTCKTLYEDFFLTLVPEEKFRKASRLTKNVIMPKLLPNLSRLHVAKFLDTEGEAENGLDYYYFAIMIAEMRMLNDFFLTSSVLIDLKNFGLKNLLKFTPSVNYTLIHLMTELNIRIDTIHLLNIPPIWERINMLLKALLPAKILGKLYIHDSIEDLHKSIPKEYLPSDYGGSQKSMDELQDMWLTELRANEELLRKLTKLRAKEVPKVPSLAMDIGMGVEGSFKKLAID